MLQELSIENFAIIAKLNISFESGMTVVTGETGAGKSIIIDALSLLVGARGSSEYIRTGFDKLCLQGLFTVDPQKNLKQVLANYGIELTDRMLILQREITTTGKNVCRINGRLVNTSTLREIGHFLVDLNGQHDQQDLLTAKKHLALLDSFAPTEINHQLADYQLKYQDYQQLEQRVREYRDHQQQFAQRLDLLNFQKQEIEAAELALDEEEQLTAQREQLLNYQKIFSGLTSAYQVLDGEDHNAQDLVSVASRELEKIEDLTPEYQVISENLRNAYYLLQEASNSVQNQLDQLFFDQEQLDQIEARLILIKNLEKKYGATIADVLEFYQKVISELAEANSLSNNTESLSENLIEKKEQVLQAGQKLRVSRQQIARKLEQKVKEELADLAMTGADFQVCFTDLNSDFNLSGLDQVEFYITTNQGEPLKPLNKVASGGELSRLLLALKTIFVKSAELSTIIFDEIDTGVSGEVAQKIAEKMKLVAKSSQVLCITHLPQVAAIADQHYFVSKVENEARVTTKLTVLSSEQRVEEVARMLSGSTITNVSRKAASELLKIGK